MQQGKQGTSLPSSGPFICIAISHYIFGIIFIVLAFQFYYHLFLLIWRLSPSPGPFNFILQNLSITNYLISHFHLRVSAIAPPHLMAAVAVDAATVDVINAAAVDEAAVDATPGDAAGASTLDAAPVDASAPIDAAPVYAVVDC